MIGALLSHARSSIGLNSAKTPQTELVGCYRDGRVDSDPTLSFVLGSVATKPKALVSNVEAVWSCNEHCFANLAAGLLQSLLPRCDWWEAGFSQLLYCHGPNHGPQALLSRTTTVRKICKRKRLESLTPQHAKPQDHEQVIDKPSAISPCGLQTPLKQERIPFSLHETL